MTKIYIVSPGERPILLDKDSSATEHVIYVDADLSDPFSIVAADTEGRAYELGTEVLQYD